MRTNDKLALQDERPTDRDLPRMSRTRLWLFGSTLTAYTAIVVAVLTTSWLVTFDWQIMLFRPYKQWPDLHAFLDAFVVLGQRGPTAVAVAAWLGWRTWQQRSLRPMLVLGTSLLLLNITVGAAKIGMGRLGPHYATTVGSAEMFAGGDIFPSGHTANAVVTWGVLAYLATTKHARRLSSVIAALAALGVGMTTIYLGTHWLSDVLLGWAAGLLVLLALPWFEPAMARANAWLMAMIQRLRESSSLASAPLSPVPAIALAASLPMDGNRGEGHEQDQEQPAREPVGVSNRSAGASRVPDGWPHHPPRPHTTRSERSPVTPTGSRRPPHSDRTPRSAPLGPVTGRGRTAGG
ncbi:phosphatase PAP2 family protein [Streptomyces sp. H27-D2]|uniref:phosphatase PAP2 family protein n=1 Tax=Streptomyces sp. H27-D2 TaxID=3046304 RepID=UPI002DB682B5|nr:phosphatase PAP2 family protein [Streptomyces sp. H27-D2]MEC4019593.1 phosphatase PAP2 family protein [Streptomyces sp. H27-D2]